MIQNTVNGHCYIGQSIDLKVRRYRHFHNLEINKHDNRYLQRAYKKYGKENFSFDVLLYCEKNELTRYEQGLVDIRNPKYNIHKECVDSPKGTKHTKETRQKISLSLTGNNWNKGKKLSEERRQKIGLRSIGNTNMLGKHHSEEAKHKMSLYRKGKKFTEEHKHKLSLAAQNRSDEYRQKQSLAQKGKKRSEEDIRKNSLSHIGIKPSEETRKKMSLAKKGKPWSEARRMAYNQQVTA
jgi:group I intron endonuclease